MTNGQVTFGGGGVVEGAVNISLVDAGVDPQEGYQVDGLWVVVVSAKIYKEFF